MRREWVERVALELIRVPSPTVPTGAWTLMIWLWMQGSVPTRKEAAAQIGVVPDTVTAWLEALAELRLLLRSGRRFLVNRPGVIEYLQNRGKDVGEMPEEDESPRAYASSAPEEKRIRAPDESVTDDRFVSDVIDILKYFRISVHAELVRSDLLQLRGEGLTVDLARVAAKRAYKAAARRFDYFEGTVPGILNGLRNASCDQDSLEPGDDRVVDIREYGFWVPGGA